MLFYSTSGIFFRGVILKHNYQHCMKGNNSMNSEKILTGYPSIDKPWLKYYSGKEITPNLTEKTLYQYLYESNKNKHSSP